MTLLLITMSLFVIVFCAWVCVCVDHRLINYIDIDTKVIKSSLTGGDTVSHVGIFVPALGTVALLTFSLV